MQKRSNQLYRRVRLARMMDGISHDHWMDHLQEKLTNVLICAKQENRSLDVTELCFDILSQNPHMTNNVKNTTTLTGEQINALPFEDRFYLYQGDQTWLFSLDNISTWIQGGNVTNPYTQKPIDKWTLDSIQRRSRYKALSTSATSSGLMRSFDTDTDTDIETADTDSDTDSDTYASISWDTATPCRRMIRRPSFNIPHKVTELFQTISHMGFYPDINGFKGMGWHDIVRFVCDLLDSWPTLQVLLTSEERNRLQELRLSEPSTPTRSEEPRLSEPLTPISSEEPRQTCSPHRNHVVHKEDQKMIVLFLLRFVTQEDGEDESRALLFTTELANYLEDEQVIASLESNDDAHDVHTSSDTEEMSWDTLLDKVGQAPDDDTFLRSVRYIIEHIVNINTYSLSHSHSCTTDDCETQPT